MKPIRFTGWAFLIIFSLGLWAPLFAAGTPDPSGVWTLKAEGPNGRDFESTLTLTWANSQLSGTINNRAGKQAIEQAKFTADQISFTVTRRIRFRKLVVTYTGKLNGDSLDGLLETKGRGASPVSIPWHATRTK